MSNNRELRDEGTNGKGEAQPGYRPRQATQEEQGSQEEALNLALVPLWNDQFEVCGVVLKDYSVYAIRNTHGYPEKNFRFDPEDIDRLLEKYSYRDILGIYHTHPSNNPRPSANDVSGWPKGEGLRYWVVTETSAYEWEKA